MTTFIKLGVICYLVVWTTGVAWLGASLVDPIHPHLRSSAFKMQSDIVTVLPGITPFIAAPLALYFADKILRRKKTFTASMAVRYFVGVPILIFLVLLLLMSATTTIFAPFTFGFGLYFGLLPLFIATLTHCLGIMALYALPAPYRNF